MIKNANDPFIIAIKSYELQTYLAIMINSTNKIDKIYFNALLLFMTFIPPILEWLFVMKIVIKI